MNNNHPNQINSQNDSAPTDQVVEVLYQKMGDRWFAFSLVDDEVFVGSLTPEEIHGASLATTTDKIGHS